MSPRKIRQALAALVLLVVCASAQTASAPQKSVDQRVDELLSKMTLEEKIGQLNQINQGMPTGTVVNGNPVTLNVEQAVTEGRIGSMLNVTGAADTNRLQKIAIEKSRLHIPLLFGFDVIHGYRTVFPIPLAIASSWDPESAKLSAQVAAREATAAGIRWTFAPMVDIARDPRWGRIAEGAGEDPFLGAAIARAYVQGFQGELNSPDHMAACAKHYVAYGAAEAGRDYNSVDLSERRLRETYLPPFEAAEDAGVATFMSSFNTIDGIPASANPFTLRKVLKGEWGFKGFVVSDWNSVGELIPHGVAADGADAARLALNAGVDMDMCSGDYIRYVAGLVKAGTIPESVVDDAARRILRVKFELGLFDHPYTDEKREANDTLTSTNMEAARDIAEKSIVLLKNDKDTLPLSKSVRSIAVIGPLADSQIDMLGNWIGKGEAKDAVTILEGIKAEAPEAKLIVSKGVGVLDPSEEGIAEAVNAARQADVAVLVLGEKGEMTGEAASRAKLGLPGKQEKLLRAVMATGKPLVLVLMNGRPLTLEWEARHVPAIVEAWFPGVQGGNAVARILFGDVNPSAKLPVTFPRSIGQIPLYYNALSTGRPFTDPKAKYESRYLDSPNTPEFPFGYGLSYTKFAYSNLQLSTARLGNTGVIKVTAEVENTGNRAGDEIVQFYTRDLVASVSRPVKELKGFQRVSLRPGEKKTVEFTINRKQVAFWNADMKYAAEPGKFEVWVGPSSMEGLEGSFVLVE